MRDIKKIVPIVSMQVEFCRVAVAKEIQIESGIRDQISALDRPHMSGDTSIGAAQSRTLWRIWVEQRRGELNISLARTLANRAAAEAKLSQVLGREKVIKKLQKRANKERLCLLERRAAQ